MSEQSDKPFSCGIPGCGQVSEFQLEKWRALGCVRCASRGALVGARIGRGGDPGTA